MRMASILFALSLLTGIGADAQAAAPVTTVPEVDLARYAGKWYEIASYPMFFQRKCVGDTTAEYSLRADGRVGVVNRCRTDTGVDQVSGRAAVQPGSGNAKLEVTFFWPFHGAYWVIGLDPDYRWAVIGHPDRKYLWILSRTPTLSAELRDAAMHAAAEQGYDLSRLRETPQSASPAVQREATGTR